MTSILFAPNTQQKPNGKTIALTGSIQATGELAAKERGIILGRKQYFEEVQTQGGKPFLERAKKYARTPQGEPLRFPNWFCEILETVGDYRIGWVGISGSAQSGKSVSTIMATVDMIVTGQLDFGWFWSDRDSRDVYAVRQWRPVAEAWIRSIEEEIGSKLRYESDATNVATWQCCGATAHFRYASTSKDAPRREGKAAIGSGGASFTANLIIEEERSQWASGIDFSARLNAGIFPSRPRRPLGTPGSGAGIEALLRDVDHYFFPHYKCPHCGIEAPLDPKGCLLTPKENKYFTRNYRPLDWWQKNDRDPVASAVISCSTCGGELTEEVRDRAWMRCRDTGLDLREYLDSIPPYDFVLRKIAVHFSPLCRVNDPNLAVSIIKEGLDEEKNARDWVQQTLGWATEAGSDRLSLETLRPLIGAVYPDRLPPRWTVAGLDQGRGQIWMWIMDIHAPINWRKMTNRQIIEQSIRVVKFAKDIHKDQIPALIKQYGVNYGIVDNEPERTWGASLAEETCFEMADQKPGHYKDFERKVVKSNGEDYPCWFINDSVYKQAVINNALELAYDGRTRYRFPSEWEILTKVKAENSPLRHLTSVSFDPVLQKWKRPADHIDDLFYAAMFAEAAFAIVLDEGADDRDVEW